ncbi:hypothetical protein [Vibrio sp. D431a]|uniref:hypothetical protein n=1 Tax=Vibrio sp. D431a TaxID=2837388 RepID=UPI0025550CBB|nr:hypothetical protein [Vibrio sp. D431a]MDK9793353.1 hypothetical protein [Vibrio sp. D431a]
MDLNAKWVSVWDTTEIETNCTVCSESGVISNIEAVDTDVNETLEREYIKVDVENREISLSLELDDTVPSICEKSLETLQEVIESEGLMQKNKDLNTNETITPTMVYKRVLESENLLTKIREIDEETPNSKWNVIDIADLIESELSISINDDDPKMCGLLLDYFNGRRAESLMHLKMLELIK